MRLLDRYLLRELLLPLGFCLCGFLVIWSSIELITELPELQKAKLRGWDVPEFCLMQVPEKLLIILPVSLLLGMLYALTQHSRSNEITAMRAAGIGLWRLGAPYLVVGFLLSLGVLALGEIVVPQANARSEEIMTRRTRTAGAARSSKTVSNLAFENTRLRHNWVIGLFHLETAVMEKLEVKRRLPDGTLSILYAERGIYTNNAWALFNVKELRAASPSDPTLSPHVYTNFLFAAHLTETPDEIRSEVKISAAMGRQKARRADIPIADLRDYLRLHPQPPPAIKHWIDTKLHGRLSAPWTCFVVVLIALPFGTGTNRRNVFAGVAGSIFIYFAFYVLSLVGLALGGGGWLPPVLAAWLPHLIFSTLAVTMIVRAR